MTSTTKQMRPNGKVGDYALIVVQDCRVMTDDDVIVLIVRSKCHPACKLAVQSRDKYG